MKRSVFFRVENTFSSEFASILILGIGDFKCPQKYLNGGELAEGSKHKTVLFPLIESFGMMDALHGDSDKFLHFNKWLKEYT